MKIRYGESMKGEAQDENAFFAYDELELPMGSAKVIEATRDTLFPSRPHQLLIEMDCQQDAFFALVGAATARAYALARKEPHMPARIFTEVLPEDEERMEMLSTQGYKDNDGLVRFSRGEIRRTPLTKPLPKGLVVVRDYLIDELEGRFFLERYNALFSAGVDEAWLSALKKRDDFCRMLAVGPEGLAGEIVVWTENGQGVVGYVHTPPKYQRQGIGSHLLEQALQYWAEHGVRGACFDVWMRLKGAMLLAATCGFRQEDLLMRYPEIGRAHV